MDGILNGLPPGILGYVQGQQQTQRRDMVGAQNAQALSGLQTAMVQRGLLEQQLGDRQLQQQRLAAFVSTLPPEQQQAAMLNPSLFMESMYKPQQVRPGGVLVQGGKEVYRAPESYTLAPGQVRMNGAEPVAALPSAPVVAPNGTVQRLDLVPIGTNLGDPNKPFLAGPDGKPVANVPFQTYEYGKAAAGKPQVTTVVNTEKPMLGKIGEGAGDAVNTAASQARASLGTISTVGNIMEALDSGKVLAGPGTKAMVVLNQLGQVLGVAGKDSTERLTQTRKVIQGLAQLELDGAQQMKGQGQITEAEREIIRRASSGDIDSMTTVELRTLMQSLDKVARLKIRANASNVDRLRNVPSAAPAIPFLEVLEPPALGGFKILGKE